MRAPLVDCIIIIIIFFRFLWQFANAEWISILLCDRRRWKQISLRRCNERYIIWIHYNLQLRYGLCVILHYSSYSNWNLIPYFVFTSSIYSIPYEIREPHWNRSNSILEIVVFLFLTFFHFKNMIHLFAWRRRQTISHWHCHSK